MTGTSKYGLLAPIVIVSALLLGGPLLYLVHESFRIFQAGRVSSGAGFTWDNYSELFHSSYLIFILDSLRISTLAACISTFIGFVIAHYVVREASPIMKTVTLGIVVSMMFIGVARIFSMSVSFGPLGIIKLIKSVSSVRGNEQWLLELGVVAGIAHSTISMATLVLVGYLVSIDRKLCEAAQSLGASRVQAFWNITMPLAAPGLVGVFLSSLALSLSAFAVPLVMGRGLVTTITILIYQRFSEVPNYPSGAALSIGLFIISLALMAASLGIITLFRSKLGGSSQ